MKKRYKSLLFCVGIFLCLYPWIGNHRQDKAHQDVIADYEEQTEKLGDARIDKELWEADHSGSTEYETILNPAGNGVMGVLDIPKIGVKLPIYHGTDETVLEKGVGHVRGSSLPTGQEGTHCILAGHRGLPNAELLLRLGELKEGDRFFIEIYNRILVYEICRIQVIRPEETERLYLASGKDLVSLVTCTPYGVNTHRLIVTGERKEEKER